MMTRGLATPLTTTRLTVGAGVLGLVVAAGAVGLAGPWDSSGQRRAEGRWAARQTAAQGRSDGGTGGARGPGTDSGRLPGPAPSAPGVLTALGASTASVPLPAGPALSDVLDPLLDSPGLGPRRSAAVMDVATGKRVYESDPGKVLTPASTTKLATAVSALASLGADHRVDTEVRTGADKGQLVLVGGGDPTLTAHKDADGFASLRTLADATADAVKAGKAGKAGKTAKDDDKGAGHGKADHDHKADHGGKEKSGRPEVSVAYDTSLYSGPLLHPIGPNENIAPVTPLMADEGRLDDSDSGPAARSADPAGDTARRFAALLRERGVDVKGEPVPGEADSEAKRLARVRSAPLSALVERMLTHSDNDIAEALARQTALAHKEPASFDGAGKAIKAELRKIKLPVGGVTFADGSGLDRTDKISPRLLTALLGRASDPARPELRPVVTGLPVAGFTGTLSSRYKDAADAAGVGLVRAKTGTLTGVNTLAGTVVDADGRLLVFAFMTEGATDPQAAQSTLDRMASTVANCGCR
ncbi:D-alanyl-D-alanine carboxypeptidase/D-alanyl-D-alanine endopeptidase [Streptomyces tsukubensis]|uniref:D-alanyl-D-alanine carboxypeptidase/D-alanyl-D-alanine-endopeptidase n=1 Tax=Streptomyces tsukubensis TaxID=83656 RepID=A0A1V4A4A7_9ACTN|nr:D-alanyl-D-alanine carboxypeptidase/D-alanyl-D-alanine-endopeptidase [Streptomyces tsukubensis]OON75402.1 D-alanyl-D-alanine carboxypeptidase/D-alanyl-D-alanine-endopeptidase [Streptomyces tsukubensis]QFR97907.1 D-alanyl-D-alanine carboxypeptidase/D-alanyl-D-alanine-endopeptidase [Streptomyces tsukubensis]